VYEGYSLLPPVSRFEVEVAYSSKTFISTRRNWYVQYKREYITGKLQCYDDCKIYEITHINPLNTELNPICQ